MVSALVVIDVQNDFCPGGALAVGGGDEIVAPINALMKEFDVVVATQDWHPANHSSFADNHAGKSAYEVVKMPYGDQILWPSHCVQGDKGAEFHKDLDIERADMIIRKGFRPEIDSYSAFFENDRKTPTGLTGYLRTRGVDHVVLVGLATDFCVYYTAMDAISEGFSATLLVDCARAIDLNGSLDAAMEAMRNAGVMIASRDDL